MKMGHVTGLLDMWMGRTCIPSLTPDLCMTDVDECVTGTHNCKPGFSCQNTKGSFYCQARQRCMDGFLQDPEGNCVGKRAVRCRSWGPESFKGLVILSDCPLLQASMSSSFECGWLGQMQKW